MVAQPVRELPAWHALDEDADALLPLRSARDRVTTPYGLFLPATQGQVLSWLEAEAIPMFVGDAETEQEPIPALRNCPSHGE